MIFVKKSILGDCRGLEEYSTRSIELTFECAAIVYKKDTVIVCLYRSQLGDVEEFLACLSDVLGDIIGRGFLK